MQRNYKLTVSVYNTITKQYELIEVSEKVRAEYLRGQGKIYRNNKRFFKHEIQMSSLIGGEDGAYENFREFVNSDNTPESEAMKNSAVSDLHKAISRLTGEEQELIIALFFDGVSEKDYATLTGVSRQAINERKQRIFKKLKKFLK